MSIRTVGVTLTDLPIICWDNLVTSTNVQAESDPDFPVSNVANPATALKWKHDAVGSPVSSIEYLTIDISQADVNYVAIAGHNFSTAGVAVGLELASWNSPLGGGESLFEPQIPADDSPLIFLFQGTNVSGDSPRISEVEGIRIVFIPTSTAAEAAVVYAGEYLQLEEGIQASHTPLPLARTTQTLSGKSESGAFLGRVLLQEGFSSPATIANMTTTFAREKMVPFLENASQYPFFWIWSPLSNRTEVAYAWLTSDPQLSFDIDGYVSVTLDMSGLA